MGEINPQQLVQKMQEATETLAMATELLTQLVGGGQGQGQNQSTPANLEAQAAPAPQQGE